MEIGGFDIIKFIEQHEFPNVPYRSIKKNYDSPENVNTDLCSECQGKCCKRCGCCFSPDDFEEISFDFLKKEIEKGYISIEYIDGEIVHSDYNYYILRVRNQGTKIFDKGYKRSPCILLTDKGCKLDYNHRPSGGKLLIPKRVNGYLNCRSRYDIEDCCKEWLPHKRILYDLACYFEDKDIPCSL